MTDAIDDLDEIEQRLTAALARIAEAHVPETGLRAPVAVRRRWPILVAAASLVLLVAGLAVVANRDVDPDPPVTSGDSTLPSATTPPTVPSESTAPPSVDASVVGVIDPQTADRVGLSPTGFLTTRTERFVSDEWALPNFAVRRDTNRIASVSWQVLPSYTWATSRLRGDEVVLENGRTAFRSDGDIQTTSIRIDDSVLTATAGPDEAPIVVEWLAAIDLDLDPAGLVPPDGFEAVQTVVETESVGYTAGTDERAESGSSSAVFALITTFRFSGPVELEDWLAARYTYVGFAPLGDDPDLAISSDFSTLAWQADPTTVVEVVGPPPAALEIIAEGLDTVPADDAGLVEGVRGLGTPGFIPEADLTRATLAATPYGRFSYVEADDGAQTCWRLTTFLGGRGDCDGEGTPPSVCVASRGTAGPWDALVIVFDQEDADIVVEHEGRAIETLVERGIAEDGASWVLAWVTGVDGEGDRFPATITVDGARCDS